MTDTFDSIKYSVSSRPLKGVPEKWISEISGEAVSYDEGGRKVIIAKTIFYYVDLDSAAKSYFPPSYILGLKNETAPFLADTYDKKFAIFSDQILTMFEDNLWGLNLFIVHKIEILPKYRGKGLAKLLIEDAERLFSANAYITALKACPLQFKSSGYNESNDKWQNSMRLSAFDVSDEQALKNLSSYYKTLGFESLGKDHIMAKLTLR